MRASTVYCVVPRELAPDLHERLRAHWRHEESVVVVVERRRAERRRAQRRRSTPRLRRRGGERRHVRGPRGRRVGDRRALALAVAGPPLPPLPHDQAERLLFVERFEQRARSAEDLETNRLLVRLQSGDRHAFDQLYTRYYDRVYAYARVALGDPHEAEDVTQQVFANAIQALPRYQVRDDFPFRGWLFRIARNNVYRALSRNGRARAEEPEQLDRRLEMTTAEDVADVDWLSDNDLAVLVERLPLAQRQVILLRYLFEMRTDEIAKALDRSPVSVRMLEHRAIRALEARLLAMKAKRPAQRA